MENSWKSEPSIYFMLQIKAEQAHDRYFLGKKLNSNIASLTKVENFIFIPGELQGELL